MYFENNNFLKFYIYIYVCCFHIQVKRVNPARSFNFLVPVKKVVIKSRGNITYDGVIGPFTEGERLILVCEAVGGKIKFINF